MGSVVAPLAEQREQPTLKDGLLHVVCECDEDKALCGADVTGQPFREHGVDCMVCLDLVFGECPHCGAPRA